MKTNSYRTVKKRKNGTFSCTNVVCLAAIGRNWATVVKVLMEL